MAPCTVQIAVSRPSIPRLASRHVRTSRRPMCKMSTCKLRTGSCPIKMIQAVVEVWLSPEYGGLLWQGRRSGLKHCLHSGPLFSTAVSQLVHLARVVNTWARELPGVDRHSTVHPSGASRLRISLSTLEYLSTIEHRSPLVSVPGHLHARCTVISAPAPSCTVGEALLGQLVLE